MTTGCCGSRFPGTLGVIHTSGPKAARLARKYAPLHGLAALERCTGHD